MSDGLAHLFGDYLAQSDWMANEKTSRSLPAAAHAFAYTACFLPVTRSPRALAVIGGTHFVIDRWRLAKYVVFAKERLAPRSTWRDWDEHTSATGYHDDLARGLPSDVLACESAKPPWMSVWLMIIADNTIHLAINRWALRRFRKPVE